MIKTKNKEIKTTRETKPCEYCGKPMFFSMGNIVERKVKFGLTRRIRNPRQDVKYHGECRKEGRRMAKKSEKANKR